MKLLLFSDLHADTGAAHRLVQLAAEADIAIGAGDFGNMRRDVGRCIPILRNMPIPAVLVPGNNESYDELKAVCAEWSMATVLHGSGTTIQGIEFFGIGGGIPPTPFGEWSFDFTEGAAAEMLRGCPNGTVLISHSPPHGLVDVASNGAHLGSRSVLEAIQFTQPKLVVCGHVHASAGHKAYLGATPVINAGPDGMIVTVKS